MGGMLQSVLGRIKTILIRRPGLTEVEVIIDGKVNKAINYDDLTGSVREGDQVVLNTTAVTLGLGTGGYHFIQCNLSHPTVNMEGGGHIMKLRYTPQQIKVLSIEENKDYVEIFNGFTSLNGFPVIISSLHSTLAPIVISLNSILSQVRVAYIMTDGGALPAKFSNVVFELKKLKMLTGIITCGHAYGGDLETVNVYSALIAAKELLNADIAIVAMGPGIVGTGTKWGFTGIEQGEIINAVNILGGKAIYSPRISFADSRARHYGLSHHSHTVLTKVALTSANVVFPHLSEEKSAYLEQQIKNSNIDEKHNIVWENGEIGFEKLFKSNIKVSTMGRSIHEEKEFFLTACAAGMYGAKILL